MHAFDVSSVAKAAAQRLIAPRACVCACACMLPQEARPLLREAAKLVEEVTPLLNELRSGGLVSNIEALTRTAADAAADIQALQAAVLTDENVRALRNSVLTLCKCVRGICGGVC